MAAWIRFIPAHRATLGLDPRVTSRRHKRSGEGAPNGPRVEPEGSAVFLTALYQWGR
jgi:hypothetical protein